MHRLPPEADHQGGAFSRRQALDAGIPRSTVTRRLASGAWRELTPRAYVTALTLVSPLTRAWAGHLTTGGTVSHASAACLHGYGPVPDAVHVTVSRRVHVDEAGVVEHRVRLEDVDVTRRDGLPITTAERTLVDLLATGSEGEARGLLFRAVQQNWLDEPALRAHIDRRRGMHGTKQLRKLVELLGTGAHSVAERRLHEILTQVPGLRWQANVPVCTPEGTFVPDVVLHDHRVVIEVDGRRYHSDAGQFGRDRERQNVLTRDGWTVLRFTWWDIVERPGYVRRMIEAIVVPSVAKVVRTEP